MPPPLALRTSAVMRPKVQAGSSEMHGARLVPHFFARNRPSLSRLTTPTGVMPPAVRSSRSSAQAALSARSSSSGAPTRIWTGTKSSASTTTARVTFSLSSASRCTKITRRLGF